METRPLERMRRIAAANRWVSATADARGRFALCGVPLDTALTLRALTDRASGQATGLRVSSAARFARTEIVLPQGRRDDRDTRRPRDGFDEQSRSRASRSRCRILSKATVDDEQGAFVLRDVPPGSQRVLVRHVGYGPVEAQVTFVGGSDDRAAHPMIAQHDPRLGRRDREVVDHQLDDFEVNKKLGLGHFLTRAELAPQEGRSTGAALTTLPGIRGFCDRIVRVGRIGTPQRDVVRQERVNGRTWTNQTMAKRAPLWDCYALVYVDDHLVLRGQKSIGGSWEPLFDINSIPVAEIEAIEYYASAAETPTKYSVSQFAVRRAGHPHAPLPPDGHHVSLDETACALTTTGATTR